MPAASPRRHVGHSAVMIAVGLLDNWTAAEVKIITAPRVAARPAAARWPKRADGEDGCLGARQGGRRLLIEEGSRRGAAICPGGDRGGGQLDIGGADLPRHHELDHDSNTGRGFASAAPPPPNIFFR